MIWLLMSKKKKKCNCWCQEESKEFNSRNKEFNCRSKDEAK